MMAETTDHGRKKLGVDHLIDIFFAVPPADEIRRLVYQHGGRYQQYYTKRSVTHIIATNLPNSKIQDLRYMYYLRLCIQF